MKHLSDEALVDLAEGKTAGLEHLDACSVCRERVRSMRHMMRALQDDAIPEPSPLFWEHLSDRISRAVGERTPAAGWLWAHNLTPVLRWSWGLATVAAIIIAAFVMRPLRSPGTVADRSISISSSGSGQRNVAAGEDVGWAVAAADQSWQVVESAAVDLDLEAAADAGIFVREGSLDRELLILSDQERLDLARAIRTELDRSRS